MTEDIQQTTTQTEPPLGIQQYQELVRENWKAVSNKFGYTLATNVLCIDHVADILKLNKEQIFGRGWNTSTLPRAVAFQEVYHCSGPVPQLFWAGVIIPKQERIARYALQVDILDELEFHHYFQLTNPQSDDVILREEHLVVFNRHHYYKKEGLDDESKKRLNLDLKQLVGVFNYLEQTKLQNEGLSSDTDAITAFLTRSSQFHARRILESIVGGRK
ncbi:hypothetical protein J4218_06160 [Candidatus Pacearchaeota archaeon]|nr:hypothetical protein [Candidatus Pacearchaeota archaeon]